MFLPQSVTKSETRHVKGKYVVEDSLRKTYSAYCYNPLPRLQLIAHASSNGQQSFYGDFVRQSWQHVRSWNRYCHSMTKTNQSNDPNLVFVRFCIYRVARNYLSKSKRLFLCHHRLYFNDFATKRKLIVCDLLSVKQSTPSCNERKRRAFIVFVYFGGAEPAKNWRCTKVPECWYLGVTFSAKFKNDIRFAMKISFHGDPGEQIGLML